MALIKSLRRDVAQKAKSCANYINLPYQDANQAAKTSHTHPVQRTIRVEVEGQRTQTHVCERMMAHPQAVLFVLCVMPFATKDCQSKETNSTSKLCCLELASHPDTVPLAAYIINL